MLISPPFLTVAQGNNDSHEDYVAKNMLGGTPGNGAFPVSFEFKWHGGIHLDAPNDLVRAIADGTVKYLRRPRMDCRPDDPLDYYKGWTSDGVVVIEHKTEIGENVEVTFYSVYMHLSAIASGVKGGQPIYRKDEIGRAGYVYGEPNKFHFDICCDDANLAKLIGRNTGKLDISRDGRTNSLWGDMYFALPAGTVILSTDMVAAQKAMNRTAAAAAQAQAKATDLAAKATKAQQDATAAATAAAGAPGNAALAQKKTQTANAASTAQNAATDAQTKATTTQADATQAANDYARMCQAGPMYSSAQPVSQAAPTYTTTQPLFVGMRYEYGNCTLTTYKESGEVVGKVATKEYEYGLYKEATDLYPACASGGYELLRFGRVLGPDALSPADAAHWRRISYPGHGEGWVDLRPDAIKKFSDADFPHWRGWTLIDDDTKIDSRCDSEALRAIVLSDGNSCVDDISHAPQRLMAADIQAKLKKTICKIPSEWDITDIDARWGWLKQDKPEDFSPLLNKCMTDEAFGKLKAHIQALAFWGSAGMSPNPYWYFEPREFIAIFRQCGWLSAQEFSQLVPSHAIRTSNQVLWESVTGLSNGPNSVGGRYRNPLNAMMRKYGICTPMRQASFFGNAVQETAWLSKLAEGNGNATWYAPWYGRGSLQLTNPENYCNYWGWRGRVVNSTLRQALVGAYSAIAALPPAQRTNAPLQDNNFQLLTAQIITWRADVAGSTTAGATPEQLFAPTDSAGFYWVKTGMARYADQPHNLQRHVVNTNHGQKTYYRSQAFWQVSATVNLPNAVNNPNFAGLNGFDSRCCAYGVALAVVAEVLFADAQSNPTLWYPEGYTPRR
jgi:predicted chitinase